MRFDELNLSDDILDALDAMHFSECTPIQEQAIDVILDGYDVIACAQTGTGKTAAYLLPVIDLLADTERKANTVRCVVMVPTHELAQQIDRQMEGFSYFVPVSSLAIHGGNDGKAFARQQHALRNGADLVIATPGRLLAHMKMGYVDLSGVEYFILDEADRMLDMGFYDDIMQIYSHLPKEVQVLMFSATMPPKIQQMASKILKNPFEVKLAVSKPAEKIKQSVYICYETQKMPILKKVFQDNPPSRVIVFSGSKLKVKNLAREFKKFPFKVAEMHSDLDQTQRDNVMLDFKAGKTQVIIATDILARGIDIDDIEMVINYDVPHEPEDYVHRIGRTARADRDGRAITFVSPEENFRLRKIEKLLEKPIEREIIPEEFGETPQLKEQESGKSGRRNSRGGSRGSNRRRGGKKDATKPESKSAETKQKPSDTAENKNGQQQNATDRPKSSRRRNRRRNNHSATSSVSANSSTSEAEVTK